MTDWQESGLCTQVGDPDLWFPAKGGNPKAAIRVCQRCPVSEQCLQYALDNHCYEGIWGGFTPNSRKGLYTGRKPMVRYECRWGHRLEPIPNGGGRKSCRVCERLRKSRKREQSPVSAA